MQVLVGLLISQWTAGKVPRVSRVPRVPGFVPSSGCPARPPTWMAATTPPTWMAGTTAKGSMPSRTLSWEFLKVGS